MSFILEALRKAQQDQQRGQAPDLRVAVGAGAAPSRRPMPRWVWGAAALGLNALVLGWWALWPRPTPPPPGSTAPPQLTDRAPAAVGGGTASADAPGLPARLPSRSRPPAQEGERGYSVPLEPAPEAQPLPPSPAGSVLAIPETARALEPPPSPNVPDRAQIARASVPEAAPPAPEAAAPLAPPAPPVRAEVDAPAPAPVTGTGAVALFGSLDPDLRKGLPVLEINGHVYAEDPAERFVFINWRGYREGERIGAADGPLLERITREGVIVDFGTVRARMPVMP